MICFSCYNRRLALAYPLTPLRLILCIARNLDSSSTIVVVSEQVALPGEGMDPGCVQCPRPLY